MGSVGQNNNSIKLSTIILATKDDIEGALKIEQQLCTSSMNTIGMYSIDKSTWTHRSADVLVGLAGVGVLLEWIPRRQVTRHLHVQALCGHNYDVGLHAVDCTEYSARESECAR